ncbi:inactive TPR repeat-containing thioredoxin TTL3-like [Phragmites australis]|uniref:inactive TPR repeat-containing thioredoxin TTL3-like n=1 Tax=Phragmites australis TaxID=29695 RepID=UPI002D784CEB|nr:inactive TPR repeat-containing thioredoxin TTL3-like [Phragmites australis]
MSHRPPAPMPDTLSDAFAAAVLLSSTDKPDTLPPGRLSPVSPLPHSSKHPTPSSSSGSSGSVSRVPLAPASGLASRRSHSGEIPLPSDALPRGPRPGHRRTGSGPLIFTSGTSACSSSATSPLTNALPAGNICPSGRLAKPLPSSCSASIPPPPPPPRATRHDVLGSGTANYGHGSIVRSRSGGTAAPSTEEDAMVRRAMSAADPEEVKRAGNEQYKKGCFEEALRLYDRALAMCPDNAACRGNRAAALIGLRRLGEAVKECEEALRIDPLYGRAHHRLASLHIRLGHIEDALKHLSLATPQPDLLELHKLQTVEKHLGRCLDARKTGDWKSVLRESDAAIAAGADSSTLLLAARAEALLRLNLLDEADMAISSASKLDYSFSCSSDTKFSGFLANAYLFYVHAQVDMALGRFDHAVSSIDKARIVDPGNTEVVTMHNKVKAVARARSLGNELFNSGKFSEACLAYGEGLKQHPVNKVLYCNRAACRFKLGQWEKSVEDCNEALKIQPNYTKALLRRAASYGKMERWAESVKDYEVLRKELPGDTEVAEAYFHSQVALKSSRGEEVSNMKFGGEVEAITGTEQFQMAISLPGVSVVHFMTPSNQQCCKISPFVNTLCTRYPSVNFLKVDVNESPAVARAENVRTIPTFKIYKNGIRVKEMICPSQQLLEYSVRHYGI